MRPEPAARGPRIDVILPVLDEAASLPWVLGRMPSNTRALVVDNGSSDDSARIAADLGALVVHEPRRGFGAACYAGLLAAETPIVAFMDADASLDPQDLPLVCDPVADRRADLIVGARIPAPGSWPWHARWANRTLAGRVRRRTGVALSDLGPMRATHRERLLELDLRDRAFGWPLEMVLRAARAGWIVQERPVPYHPRVGRSKVTGTIRGTSAAIRDMSRLLAQQP